MSDWTIVTVTYNSAATLKSHWPTAIPSGIKWIVVDNASADDSVDAARARGASVECLPQNVGFSTANNRGLAGVTTDYVAFVNPDVRVDWNSLGDLARHLDERGGLIAPQLRNPDGTLQPNARGAPFLFDKFAHRGLRLPLSRESEYVLNDRPIGNEVEPVAWVIGAAIAARTEAFRELGAWDERFFLYYEDHELGLRAWRSGVPVWLDQTISWEHSWDRATTRLSFPHWRHEIASAAKFFLRYPSLLIPTHRMRERFANRYGLPHSKRSSS